MNANDYSGAKRRYAACWPLCVMQIGLVADAEIRIAAKCPSVNRLADLPVPAALPYASSARGRARYAGRPTDSLGGRTRIGGNSMSTNTATRSRLAEAVPQFSVSDVLATVHYYRDRLGFAVGDLVADPPEWGAVGRDDVELFFNRLPPGASSHPRIRALGAYRCLFPGQRRRPTCRRVSRAWRRDSGRTDEPNLRCTRGRHRRSQWSCAGFR